MRMPRVMIAAPASGSGKTMITCGILQALVDRDLNVTSFKCGPDYIDPMFHSRVIGTRSKNLDAFFADPGLLRYLFGRSAKGSDISVTEGVMGFYDGMGIASSEASSYDVSQKLGMPVVLTVNCRGASISAAAVVKGFLEFRKNNIKGVILNNASEAMHRELKGVIEKETGTKVIGYVPNVKELVIESRHLGLLMPSEIPLLKEKLTALADLLERTVDLDALIGIADSADELEFSEPPCRMLTKKVKIGLAEDEAFCFMYADNIELLERCGAEIVRFSPLRDRTLPDGICGMILPGGYPELHAEALSRNTSMTGDIMNKVGKGMPCMAECGGFMYLHDELEDQDGTFHRMIGAVKGRAYNLKKLSRFGYISVNAKRDGTILENGTVKGHEFHYWESTDAGRDCDAVRPARGSRYECMHCSGNMMAGFPHLYYYSNTDVPYNFLLKCTEYRNARTV
ncbi:MAG: cobyrinate a,c-diamide synthase [Methanomassiliicoccaceae archaeon]|jgi:cobyrinic acid a,c-diamide synthase|nr:cobyrinate a,c-diamide synthase [Methanomassiliicoccaceae archaeon]